jgi:hypothetical protein
MPNFVNPPRPVNDDTGDPRVPCRISVDRDHDVDKRGRALKETSQFGGGLMAEDGAITGTEQRRPEFRLAWRGPGERGVDATSQPLPTSVPQLTSHNVPVEAVPDHLPAAEDTGLGDDQIPDTGRKFECHTASVTGGRRRYESQSRTCG